MEKDRIVHHQEQKAEERKENWGTQRLVAPALLIQEQKQRPRGGSGCSPWLRALGQAPASPWALFPIRWGGGEVMTQVSLGPFQPCHSRFPVKTRKLSLDGQEDRITWGTDRPPTRSPRNHVPSPQRGKSVSSYCF